MSSIPEHPALKECLESLSHLFIDITRLKHEPAYEEKRGGYCDLQVATLDQKIPCASKRLVAAKKLLLGIQSSEPLRLALRLARELKVWAGLRHPHVLPLLGFYVDDNYKTAVLISEYMEHGDLKDYIVRVKPSYDARLWLIRDLTDGLTYLHTRPEPIRHGDLKPRNVLVNPHTRALITDFGLSKALDAGPTGFTTGNDARCTVRFSSPEILLQGVKAESIADDIWSWGCLVLEAMTDEVPFAEIQSEHQIILALVQGRSPCDRENLTLRLPQLQDLLAKCWSFQANQRPTAAECLGIVQDALSLGWQHPPGERTPTPSPVTQSSQALQASSQVDQQPQPYPSTQLSAQGTGGSHPQQSLWISSSPLASEDSWSQHGGSADSPVPSFETSVQEWTSREDIPEDEAYVGSQTGENTFDGHRDTMVLDETPGRVAGSSGTQRTTEAHSSVGDSRKTRSSGRFPHKLYQLAGDLRAQLFISWSSDGKNIVFSDPVALQGSGLLRDYFSHNTWSTVVRQLGLYGFRKIKRARGGTSHAYHHHNFLRDREDLLDEVKLKPTPSSIRRALRKQGLQSIPDPLPPMT